MSASRLFRVRAALRVAPVVATVAVSLALRPPVASAQAGSALAARVTAAEGTVALRYATRAAACGNGRDFLALGESSLGQFVSVGSGDRYVTGRGWSGTPCVHGPARATLTVHGGAVTDVRVRVGGAPGAASDAVPAVDAPRDLGAVDAADAARYFLVLAGRLTGRAAEQAVAAASVADSADVWRPLLALARGGAADERTQRTAMHWLGAVAPPEAVPTMAALLRDVAERRAVREGAAVVLALAPGGAGVPALSAAARGEPAAGGGEAWVRDRAVFWLGNAHDPRARATLRTLAAADTAPESVRAQAIFTLGHVDRAPDRDDTDANGNAAFLRTLYRRLTTPRLREQVIQSVAQDEDAASRRWLLDRTADTTEPLEARKQALFWAGQQEDVPIADLLGLDARLTGAELRKHYTFVLSQRREDAAVDRLIAIAHADADADVRRQAIFWLGQSRNPRARRYLEAVVAQ